MRVLRMLFALVVLSLAGGSGCDVIGLHGDWSDQAVRESQDRGNAIVGALEKFRQDQGRYPAQLSDLTPKYLSQIEEPVAGTRPWKYATDKTGSAFDLSFGGGARLEPVSWYSPGAPPDTPDLLPDWGVDTR